MADEQERTATAPGNFQREQVNAPTRPGRPELAAESTQQHAPLFLPGQAALPLTTYTEDTQAFQTPPAALPHPQPAALGAAPVVTRKLQATTAVQPHATPTGPIVSGKRDLRLLWLAGGLIFIVLFALAFVALSSLVAPHERLEQGQMATNASQTATNTPQTPVVSAPGLIDGFTLAPDRFTSANCAVDNGYRCTATLYYAQVPQGSVNWTAYGTGVATKFSPASGMISPGQQQQVIIYVYTPCPNNGHFVFLINNAKTSLQVPWSC